MSAISEAYRIRINRDCFGADPTHDPLPDEMPFLSSNSVMVDLADVAFVRPSGLAFVFALTFTLLRAGYSVTIREPEVIAARDYLVRTNFWGIMEQQGFEIPATWRGFNLGGAQGLIEPSIVRTDASTRDNVETSVLLFERLRRALDRAGLRGRERAASVFSELSLNAAEHSLSPRGAFVMAQAYPANEEIEIAVADVGRGIRGSLGPDRFATDVEAALAALREEVTGRRDAGGNPAEGGYGLPSVAAEADYLEIRTGNVLLEGSHARNPQGELVLSPRTVSALDGTLVVAIVSTQR